jgi:succinyl-CoA synthetase beta subunit
MSDLHDQGRHLPSVAGTRTGLSSAQRPETAVAVKPGLLTAVKVAVECGVIDSASSETGAAERDFDSFNIGRNMKIHEYQAKELLRKYGVVTPRGIPCFSVEEAVQAAEQLGGSVWVVKAQIHAGGRGKGGGVKVAKSLGEVRSYACAILGMQLKTHQTGPEGQKVRRLLIEEGADIRKELYVGLVVDRGSQRAVLMASSEGGMDIEEVAEHTPEKIHKVAIDPVAGLTDTDADAIARKIGVPEGSVPQARQMLQALYTAFDATDASLAEINPLILTGDGRVIALDAKIDFDNNALFRHPDIFALRDLDEEDPAEVEASKHDLNYIQLDGNIGCLVNGAGLAMASMDIIKLYGGSPANFLDVGGSATTQKVTEAFKIMLRNPELKAILVNIFGGIMKCDVIAQGVVEAARQVGLTVPLVVRLEGTNVELGKKILADSGLPIISGNNMADAAQKVVAAAKGRTPAGAKAAKKPSGGRKAGAGKTVKAQAKKAVAKKTAKPAKKGAKKTVKKPVKKSTRKAAKKSAAVKATKKRSAKKSGALRTVKKAVKAAKGRKAAAVKAGKTKTKARKSVKKAAK